MFVFILLTIIVALFVYKHYVTFSYWSKKGVKGPKPDLLYGNLTKYAWTHKQSLGALVTQIYNDYEGEKVVGIYQGLTPTLIIRDPKMINLILINDFSKFNSRGFARQTQATNLFSSEKNQWKAIRSHISPLFTTLKLKEMVLSLNEHVNKHMDFMDRLVSNVPTPVEIRKINTKYTIKSFSSTFLGIDFDPYSEETTSIETIASESIRIDDVRLNLYLLSSFIPDIVGKIIFTVFKSKTYPFFNNLVKRMLQDREHGPKNRQDFFERLNLLKNKGIIDKRRITDVNCTLETSFFFVAGFETASLTITFLLYELALNPIIQSNCQKEIEAVMRKYNNKLDYDTVTKELKYLSMVFDETLRKYPVAGLISRESLADYTFEEINLTITKGTRVWIPTVAIHNDPKYFPEPEKFDPERFSPENAKNLNNIYYPFGNGPRICVAFRFAKLNTLLTVAHFLQKFQVSPCEKTVKTISYGPRNALLTPVNGIWLSIEKRSRQI